VPRVRATDSFNSRRGPGSGAQTTMQPTAAIRHRRTLAGGFSSCLRAAPWDVLRVAATVPIL